MKIIKGTGGKSGAFTLALLLLGASAAQAFEVDFQGSNATGIRNLSVEGVYYDVTFLTDTGVSVYGEPPVFDFTGGNAEEAGVIAVNAVNAALNTIPAVQTVGDGQNTDRFHIGLESDEEFGNTFIATLVGEYNGIWDPCDYPSDGCVGGTTTTKESEVVTWAAFSTPPGSPPSEPVAGGDLAG